MISTWSCCSLERNDCVQSSERYLFFLHSGSILTSCSPIPGAAERISALRNRNAKVSASLDHYEQLVEEQSEQLGRMNGISTAGLDDEADEEVVASGGNITTSHDEDVPMTAEDLKSQEEDIAELERRKRTLEERVSGIEKDLGGLMR